MKKIILTAAIAFAISLGVNKTVQAETIGKQEVSTMLTDVKNIREIEVHGNVQVYLTSGNTENVKVYGDYFADNALVQEQDNVLRITSYNTKTLVVWVTVEDLAKLSVFDNASVSSFGKLSAIDLHVTLNNQAVAQLDLDAIDASFTLKERASANLTGNVENGNLQYDATALLNTGNLTATNLTQTQSMTPKPVKHFHHINPALIVG